MLRKKNHQKFNTSFKALKIPEMLVQMMRKTNNIPKIAERK